MLDHKESEEPAGGKPSLKEALAKSSPGSPGDGGVIDEE